MRAVCFVKRLEWDVPGTVFRHAIAIGDIDNDGENELVIGNTEGELYIFKGEELWQKITDLGFITCVSIGDVFNYDRNALVVVGGDGWVNIYYSPKAMNPSTGSKKSAQLNLEPNLSSTSVTNTASTYSITNNTEQNDNTSESFDLFGKMECVHIQRIPPNTKVVLIADVDNDGANEVILGLTDRVVRSYRWSSNADLESGRLIGLNKWECANQIGTITLQHSANGTPTLLVAQPGGTLMKIKCNPDDCFFDEASDANSEVAANYVDYQTLQSAQMRNPNISTEVLGDLELFTECSELLTSGSSKLQDDIPDFKPVSPENDASTNNFSKSHTKPDDRGESVDQVDGNILGGNIILGDIDTATKKKPIFPTFKDFITSDQESHKESHQHTTTFCPKDNDSAKSIPDFTNSKNKPYALATLDGTIILMRDEVVSWAIQVDHHLFALCRLDVTGDGADEIVACAWDGQTYILDQNRNCVRFQFEEPVMAFCTGMYNANTKTATPCFVYKTFNNKVFLYYDVTLKSMTLKPLNPLHQLDNKNREILEKLLNNSQGKDKEKKLRELTRWLLYRNQ